MTWSDFARFLTVIIICAALNALDVHFLGGTRMTFIELTTFAMGWTILSAIHDARKDPS